MIVLDTHVLIWDRHGDSQLGRRARLRIERAVQEGDAAVSAITFWEAAMLYNRGRVKLDQDVWLWRSTLLREGLIEIPVDGEIAMRAEYIQDFHRDPADRFIVATALAGHQLMTADERILGWPGNLARLDARV